MLQHFKMRDDEWALDVRGRLEFVQDLHAADALYHQQCSVHFRTLKQIPVVFSPPSKKAKMQGGRKSTVFRNVTTFCFPFISDMIILSPKCSFNLFFICCTP
jgi:hypothetical protein